ncbi:hypothetical protein Q7X32_00295 [Glaesserella parasuis]|uniref:hypothetical protein n=1 Tax=Glaesserella parasuis TaxID=738 RepID=UPI00094F84C5|nr:hypothetical protein [Glaesserella parasuis]MDO9893518.1 hypothetical protein [Glaesserella parasuis]MDP0375888.1 hypothetical protein [Glaesserella parasuis]
MQEIRSLNGDIIGYSLPPEWKQMQELVDLIKSAQQGICPPDEFLIQLQNLGGKPLGKILSTQWQESIPFISHADIVFKNLKQIQNAIGSIKISDANTEIKGTIQEFQQVSTELEENKGLSVKEFVSLAFQIIFLFSAILSMINDGIDLYEKLNDDPITNICGEILKIEKKIALFVEVNHSQGVSVYQYPKGKKSKHYALNGTQMCMLQEPKGNTKRVKVVFQVEKDKQIIGYVDRNKLKRLYK